MKARAHNNEDILQEYKLSKIWKLNCWRSFFPLFPGESKLQFIDMHKDKNMTFMSHSYLSFTL